MAENKAKGNNQKNNKPAKKVPQRMCIACHTVKDKREMYRIVKFGDKISLDKTGKANGRGAYICKDEECFKKLKKGKLLNRTFSCDVPDEVYDAISEEFLGKQ